MQEQAAEATIASVAQKVAVGGGGSAVVLGLTADWLAALAGVLVGLLGLGVQLYYKIKADRREAEFHAARMQELRERGP